MEDVRAPISCKPSVRGVICKDKHKELTCADNSVKPMYNGLSFKLLFLMSEWKYNVSPYVIINFGIFLPSTVEKGLSRAKIIEDREMLPLTVHWPVH